MVDEGLVIRIVVERILLFEAAAEDVKKALRICKRGRL
jgi:hypothetical protein